MLRIRAGLLTVFTIVASTLTSQLVGLSIARASDAGWTGTHPWAVIDCNFTNQPADPVSWSYYNEMYGDAGAGHGEYNFVDYWHDVSFGQLSVAGTQVIHGPNADSNGWYTIPETRDEWAFSKDRFGKIQDCANAAAADVNFNDFYGVIAQFPEAATRLVGNIDASTTTITVADAPHGSGFDVAATNYYPSTPFLANIDDGSPGNNETVNVTNISGTTWTITRAQHGTSAKSHNNGAGVAAPGDYGEISNSANGPGPSDVTIAGTTYHLAMVLLAHEGNLTGAAHETGHGFGFNHSRKLSTSTQDYLDATDDMSAYADTLEYTSLGATFGGAILGSLPNDKGPGLTSINLDIQGWIPGPRHFTMGSSQQSVTLHALGDPSALTAPSSQYLQARLTDHVTIPVSYPDPADPRNNPPLVGNTTSDYLTVDYREASGWDSGFPRTNGQPGDVVLHLHAPDQFQSDNYGYAYWVDQTPDAHGGYLIPGDEYVDAGNSVYLAVNGEDGPGHAATVTMGSSPLHVQFGSWGATSGDYNHTVTLATTVTTDGVTPVPNADVTFTLGSQVCEAHTNAAGQVSCPVTLTDHPGAYTLSAHMASDAAYAGDTATTAFTINRTPTRLIGITSETNSYAYPGYIYGGLQDADSGVGLPGKSIYFQVGDDTTDSCTGTTDSNGFVACQLPANTDIGTYPLNVSFAGDDYYLPAGDSRSTYTITPAPTHLQYSGDTSGDYHDPATFTATLTHAQTHATLPGRAVTFTIGSSAADTCTAATDATGLATCTITPSQPAGNYPLTISFAGEHNYQPVSDSSTTFTINREETTVTYTGATTFTHGGPALLRGTLLEDGATPVIGATLGFTLGSGPTMQSCTGVTDSSGNASCTIAQDLQPLGAGTVAAMFDGDPFYLGGSDGGATTTLGEGVAVGLGGTIVRTTDSGAHWATVPSGTTRDLLGVSESVTNAFAVGKAGTILASTDGGQHWTTQTSGTTKDLRGVDCPSPTTCFAVGQHGTVLRGNGTSWTSMTTPNDQDLNGISCPNTSVCFAAANDGSVLALSGGVWTRELTVKSPKRLDSISCVSTTTCVAVGDGGFAVGTVDGLHWALLSPGTTRELLSDACSGGSCVAAGKNGTIVMTTDGGTTWAPAPSGTVENLTGAELLDPTQGFIVGTDGVILVTRSGGVWETQTPAAEPQKNLQEVSFA